MRTAVVLPAPFGPSRPSTVPGGALKSIPHSARTFPKDFSTPSASIAAGPDMELNLAARLPGPSEQRSVAESHIARMYSPRATLDNPLTSVGRAPEQTAIAQILLTARRGGASVPRSWRILSTTRT